MNDMQRYVQAAAEVARIAGDFAMTHYKTGVDVIMKSDGSPVTIADRGAEEAARAWIQQRFPDDGIVGEEFEAIRPEATRKWLIDPIDGTKSFVRSVPLWGTLIAVAAGETVLAGCAYFPVLREIVVAAGGEGCWWNDIRCSVSDVSTLDAATVVTTDTRFTQRPMHAERWKTLSERAQIARTWGDCYGYLLVATGRAEVMADDVMAPWDTAALQPIITEAGGVITNWRGRQTSFGGDVIATNAALARDVRNILVG